MGDHGSAFNFVIGARKKPECGKPCKKQILLETGVSFLHDFFKDILGEEGKMYIPYLMTVVIYIGIANIFGALDLYRLQRILNCTIGLALTSIFLDEYAGFHKKG